MGVLEPAAQRATAALGEVGDHPFVSFDQCHRRGQHRAAAKLIEPGLLSGQPRSDRLSHPAPGRGDGFQLEGDVGHDLSGCVGGG